MQGRKHQVSGFGCGNRNTDGFKVTHLSDKNHIRIFTEGRTKCIGIRLGIQTDFPLVYHGLLMLMQIFNRILQRNYMAFPVVINFIDNRRQCGRLTASGRSRYQNQTFLTLIQVNDWLRHTKHLRWWNLGSDKPQCNCHRTSLTVRIDTVSSQIRNRKRHIMFAIPVKHGSLPLIHKLIQHLQGIRRQKPVIVHRD